MRCIVTLLILSFVCILFAESAFSEEKLIVITNNPNIEKLSKVQIKQIYLRGGGLDLTPINYEVGNDLRIVFNSNILGLTEARLQAYWAQMKFTGRAKEPEEHSSAQVIISIMLKRQSVIAYVKDDTEIPADFIILYEVKY